MSIATVSTNKLPFAIQTILGGDDEQLKISESERSSSKSDLPRKNYDQSCLPECPDIISIAPYHFPCILTRIEFQQGARNRVHSLPENRKQTENPKQVGQRNRTTQIDESLKMDSKHIAFMACSIKSKSSARYCSCA
uniref:Bm14179 n=1 Tax=Brugia malayi TaxID=6279 RepID=A0A0J9XT11_BRUMA|nr:Bm14179 [Brugia malayi]